MRVWFLHPGYLDTKRLNSQHYESHAIFTIITSGGNWGSMRRHFATSLDYVQRVHDLCVEEMLLRGKAHSTPYPEIHESFKITPFEPTLEQIRTDVIQLRLKWDNEGYYFGCGRLDLRRLEDMLALPVGPDPDYISSYQALTRHLISKNRDFFKNCKGRRIQDKMAEWRQHRLMSQTE